MKITSHIISWVFLPLFMPIYALLLTMYVPSYQDYFYSTDCLYTIDPALKTRILILYFLFCTLFPGVSYAIMLKSKMISTIDIQNRAERFLPIFIMLAYCLGLYFFMLLFSSKIIIPKFLLAFPLSGAFVCILFYFLNRWKKVSIHAGSVGITTGFILSYDVQHVYYQFWIIVLVFIISGLVMSARLYLKRHTLTEVVVGWISGTILTFTLNYYY